MGEYQQQLYVSLRTDDEAGDAGALLKDMMTGIGSCGGHPSMAGGQVPLGAFVDEEKRAVREDLIALWLAGLDQTGCEVTPLLLESET
jgi:nanoRNase/pAp phosphatase (c-di-AMP/oligoRNAs hydrolase)